MKTITTIIILCCLMAITVCCCCGGLGSIQYHDPFRNFDQYFFNIERPDGFYEEGETLHTDLSFAGNNVN